MSVIKWNAVIFVAFCYCCCKRHVIIIIINANVIFFFCVKQDEKKGNKKIFKVANSAQLYYIDGHNADNLPFSMQSINNFAQDNSNGP